MRFWQEGAAIAPIISADTGNCRSKYGILFIEFNNIPVIHNYSVRKFLPDMYCRMSNWFIPQSE